MAEKSPEAFRTISEVAEEVRVPAHVLRFWESRFTQIRPVKRAGGRRYYRPEDVELIAGIKRLLHDHGMTIRGVQKLLKDHGTAHVAGLATMAAPQPGGPGLAPFAPPPALAPALPGAGWPGGDGAEEAEEAEPRDAFHAEPLPRPPIRAASHHVPAPPPRRNGAHPAGDPAVPPPARAPEMPVAEMAPARPDTRPDTRPDGPEVEAADSSTPEPGARLRLSLSPGLAGQDGPAPNTATVLSQLLTGPGGGVSVGADRLRPLIVRLVALRDRLAADLPATRPH